MKTATITELRARVADFFDHDEPVLVTRHGKPAAVLYPLHDPRKLPLEVRRTLFRSFAEEIGAQLDAKGVTEEEIERDFAAFKKRRRR